MQKHGCILFVMEVLSMLEHFCGMVGDIFFSELTINDMEGQGTVSCQEFGQIIGNTVVQVQIRLDPERKFAYPTKRTRVYNLVDDTDSVDQIESIQDPGINNLHEMPTDITFRDHHFDTQLRKRVCGKSKEGTVLRARFVTEGISGCSLGKSRL
ncbi:uncharacterized protein LOC128175217 [Crassostrea angulata]|uniref:uncharacterized protein LOC128175217 n=1 Tax=Magallana angulata TaxID=2784310 RepID=UPI0022B0B5D8|nr:uncharacterized protein LOC128175217 [Crassostrea angulata]